MKAAEKSLRLRTDRENPRALPVGRERRTPVTGVLRRVSVSLTLLLGVSLLSLSCFGTISSLVSLLDWVNWKTPLFLQWRGTASGETFFLKLAAVRWWTASSVFCCSCVFGARTETDSSVLWKNQNNNKYENYRKNMASQEEYTNQAVTPF